MMVLKKHFFGRSREHEFQSYDITTAWLVSGNDGQTLNVGHAIQPGHVLLIKCLQLYRSLFIMYIKAYFMISSFVWNLCVCQPDSQRQLQSLQSESFCCFFLIWMSLHRWGMTFGLWPGAYNAHTTLLQCSRQRHTVGSMKQRKGLNRESNTHMNNVEAGRRPSWNTAHFVADIITSNVA